MSKNGELLINRGKNLLKRAKDLYSTNFEMLMKKTADNTDGERETTCNWIGSQHCWSDHTTQSKLQVQHNPFQIVNGILHIPRTKECLSLNGNAKDPEHPKHYWERTTEREEPGFLTSDYRQTIEIQTLWSWRRDRHRSVEQNSISRWTSRTRGHLIDNRAGKNIQWRKDNLFNKGARKLDNCIRNDEIRTFSDTIRKNTLKMD